MAGDDVTYTIDVRCILIFTSAAGRQFELLFLLLVPG
jgi:hypothetical protein